MYDITVKHNETGVIFTKSFSSPFLAQRFINRVKRSKKLAILVKPYIPF